MNTELGEKEKKSEIHSGIIIYKPEHIQHLAPRERSKLQNVFPCTELGPPSNYYVHMSLLHSQPYLKNTKPKENISLHSLHSTKHVTSHVR